MYPSNTTKVKSDCTSFRNTLSPSFNPGYEVQEFTYFRYQMAVC